MRSFIFPMLITAAIGLPFVFSSQSKSRQDQARYQTQNPFGQRFNNNQSGFGIPAHQASTGYAQLPNQSTFPTQQNGQFVSHQTVAPGVPSHLASSPMNSSMLGGGGTVILPGTANGPDLSATPMEFMPINNLAEIFRFDIFPNWVKNRWPRVSTAPTEPGLHGMRVALVTGVNQSDLHGSLTYHFDVNQRIQRISFQGWTGDTARLVKLLGDSFDFRAQPTHFAGLYLSGNRRAQTGALIMKHPDVVRANNPNQQVAVVLEINNPKGNFPLSQTMQQSLVSATENR